MSDFKKYTIWSVYFFIVKTPADFDWYDIIKLISNEKFTSLPNLTFYYDHDIHS